jgi:tetratricopeptide (TPR) repeat protein
MSGVVVTGDQAVVHTTFLSAPAAAGAVLLPAAAVDAPPALVDLPVRPGLFVGRTEILSRLDTLRAAGPAAHVVHGLGGVGKSTVAAHWAATRCADHNPIWWITADTPAALDAGLARLAAALQPALGAVLPAEALRERAVQWLAAHDGWLLILDDVSDPGDVTALLARCRTGRFLITSRRATGWAGIAAPVALDTLPPHDAVELMTRVLHWDGGDPGHDLDGIAAVCAELGSLPLAVEQAAAYLAETGIGARDYLRLLARHPADVYEHTGEGRRSIARIWRVTLDRLSGDPMPHRILRVLAWYAPEAVPRTLLDPLGPAPDVIRAVGRLAAYSLLSADASTVAVHRLVQAVARTPDAADPHRHADDIATARTTALTLLLTALPGDWQNPATWPAYRALLPHIDAYAALTGTDIPDTPDAARLLRLAGLFLADQGAIGRAVQLLDRVHTHRLRDPGPEHPDTLTAAHDLASAHRVANDLHRAVPLYERTLAARARLLGREHPDTLVTADNLGYAYRVSGQLARATTLLEQTLPAIRQALGADHPDSLATAENLAGAYREAGDVTRAVALQEETAAAIRRLLGPDHPQTLTSEANLAYAYRAAGDLGRAVDLYEAVIADRRRVLGADHPQTLAAVSYLAAAHQDAGEVDRAVTLFEGVHADMRRVLGPDHPQTTTVHAELAAARRAASPPGGSVWPGQQPGTGFQRSTG